MKSAEHRSSSAPDRLPDGIEWRRSEGLVDYRSAMDEQQLRNSAIANEEASELVWMLEHPPVYTAGTSADADELLDPRFDVVKTGRGGRYTYHGPGQRVTYVLLNLAKRNRDVRAFVHRLEDWVIHTLGDFGVEAFAVPDRIGIWTRGAGGSEAKIGAIGVRVRRWVTMHGFAVNLSPDLAHFAGIVPCGIAEYGVTSMAELGKAVAPDEWDEALLARAGEFLRALEDQ
ncbi:lipoyl(octanoyl) transferase LipB [Erythrobacter alti]|uniref:lipoyl(octanoyl) transferase LipB n=1 Tax=Erythrobacter alti TaxID=1896145 RepID=UPI0030F39E00